MKGIWIFCFFLFLLLALSTSFRACGRDSWVRYAEDKKGSHFYSPGSMERGEDGAMKLNERVMEERGWFVSVIRFYRYDFDCTGRRYIRYVESETRRSGCSRETSGVMNRAKEAAPLLDVRPGSTVERLYRVACNDGT